MKRILILGLLLLLVLLVPLAAPGTHAQSGGGYALQWFTIEAGGSTTIRLRWSSDPLKRPFADFDDICERRLKEANDFYARLQHDLEPGLPTRCPDPPDDRAVVERAGHRVRRVGPASPTPPRRAGGHVIPECRRRSCWRSLRRRSSWKR